jgi:LacI family sucrose operon transcriptional repressor
MKKLNYQPNEVARSLSKQTSNTIGVIVPHIRHPYFAQLISEIELAANNRDFKMLLFNSKDRNERERRLLEMCTSARVAGVILCSGSVAMEEFKGINVPLVTIERNLENGTAAVECDNLRGGRLAAKHLIDKGCKNIAHISGVCNNPMPADDRETGFVEICNQYGVNHLELKTNSTQYNAGTYHEFINEILNNIKI